MCERRHGSGAWAWGRRRDSEKMGKELTSLPLSTSVPKSSKLNMSLMSGVSLLDVAEGVDKDMVDGRERENGGKDGRGREVVMGDMGGRVSGR